MKILYRIIKYSLIFVLLLIIIGGMAIKTFNYEGKNLNSYSRLIISVLETLEKWVLKDDYKENILVKIEKYKNEFNNLISERVARFSTIKNDSRFLESAFVYFVSKNTEKLDDYFSSFPEFKDIIIIDKDNNLIYKKSDISYQLLWRDIKDDIDIKNINGEIVLLQNYFDKSFDIEFQIIAVLNSDEIRSLLKTSSFPASYVVADKILKNDRFPESWLKGLNLSETQKIYKGIYNLSVFPIIFNLKNYGSLVMLYPVRDFGSILILLLKILLLIIVVLSLYELDRFIEGKINLINVTNKQRLQMRKLKRNKVVSEEIDKEYEKSLDWVGKYIEKTEGKK